MRTTIRTTTDVSCEQPEKPEPTPRDDDDDETPDDEEEDDDEDD